MTNLGVILYACQYKTFQLSYHSDDNTRQRDTCCSASFPTLQCPLLESNYQVEKYKNTNSIAPKPATCQVFPSTHYNLALRMHTDSQRTRGSKTTGLPLQQRAAEFGIYILITSFWCCIFPYSGCHHFITTL